MCPTTVDDYRALYRGYLADPDLQDARARWPFVCMWDNHEFSWKGWQSQQNFGGGVAPGADAQGRGQPGLVRVSAGAGGQAGRPALRPLRAARRRRRADPRRSTSTAWAEKPDNLAAIDSLKIYRTLRWGAQRRADPHRQPLVPLRAGRPTRRRPRRSSPGRSRTSSRRTSSRSWMPGARMAAASRRRPSASTAPTCPIPRRTRRPPRCSAPSRRPGSSTGCAPRPRPGSCGGTRVGMLDWRTDLQNLPAERRPRWPADGYGLARRRRLVRLPHRAREILDFVGRERHRRLRHHRRRPARLLGRRPLDVAAAASLTSRSASEFITGSISAPSAVRERAAQPEAGPAAGARSTSTTRPAAARPRAGDQPARSATASAPASPSQKTGDRRQALAATNPEVAPHLVVRRPRRPRLRRRPRERRGSAKSSSSASRVRSSGATAPTAARSPTGSPTGRSAGPRHGAADWSARAPRASCRSDRRGNPWGWRRHRAIVRHENDAAPPPLA